MVRKAVFRITLILLLTLSLSIQLAKAEGTIYIRPDGSIDPPTAPIQQVADIYTLNGNLYCSLVVQRNNTVVDGAGYTVQGAGDYESKGISLTGRTNVTIKNMEIKGFWYAIYLVWSLNSSLYGNNITNNAYGIRLFGSTNNEISKNNITANNWDGIWLYKSSNNTIFANTITANKWDSVWLWDSSDNNSICGNTITASGDDGVVLSVSSDNNRVSGNTITAGQGDGIWLYYSSGNTIFGNNVKNHGFGIGLEGSSNNSVYGNTITNNLYGIRFDGSSKNFIYHNKFVDNTLQVKIYTEDSVNVWDDGYPSGGNYWSDYESLDFYSGPFQNETGSDGVGDMPYVIDANNQDRFPFSPLLGDVNWDWKVDGRDIAVVAQAFASYPTHPRWNPLADLNHDNKIDGRDIALVAKNFGKTHS